MVSKKENSLEAELAVAKVEEVLKRGTEEVEDHGVVLALGAVPPHKRDPDTTCEGLVDLGLIFELGMLGLDGLELDCDFLAGNNIDSEIDIA